MATFKRDQLARRVLQRMAIAIDGVEPSFEDIALMLDRVNDALIEGRQKGLVWWDFEETPAQYADAFETVIAGKAALFFQMPELTASEKEGWKRLYELTANPYRPDRPTKVSYI